jgi:hypothetical protein
MASSLAKKCTSSSHHVCVSTFPSLTSSFSGSWRAGVVAYFWVHYHHTLGYANGGSRSPRLALSGIVNSPSEEDTAEAITELIDLLLKKMGDAKDHRISKESFRAAVEKDRLLLQVFGPCLPDKKFVDSFITQNTLDIFRRRY